MSHYPPNHRLDIPALPLYHRLAAALMLTAVWN